MSIRPWHRNSCKGHDMSVCIEAWESYIEDVAARTAAIIAWTVVVITRVESTIARPFPSNQGEAFLMLINSHGILKGPTPYLGIGWRVVYFGGMSFHAMLRRQNIAHVHQQCHISNPSLIQCDNNFFICFCLKVALPGSGGLAILLLRRAKS